MRVLQLGPYPPPHGGVQSNLVAIRSFLLKRNIACAVINITRHRKPEKEEVYYPKTALALVRLLLRLDYDVIHLHVGGMLNNRVLALALVCCLMPRSKAVLTFHSGGYPSSSQGRKSGSRSLTGFVFRRFDRLIAVNSAIIEFFHKLGVPAERTRLIHPHAFPADLATATLPENMARFIESHTPTLISVGLLEPEYDLPLQIEALGEVRKTFPEAGLVMIGSGSLEAELRARIAAQRYGRHIMLCGDVPHAVTLQAISRSDVMLRTTLYDGDAVSVREALYVGTPVIATDNGMRPPGVQLIPKQDLQALTACIQQVRNGQGRKPAALPHSDDTNIEAVFKVYQELTRE